MSVAVCTARMNNCGSPEKEEEQFGKRQSPIDIKTCEAVHERVKRSIDSQPLQIDYSKLNGVEMTLENTGHGWQLKVPDEVAAKCPITGGKLKDKYQLLQIHAHWGKNSHSGSEHTINGKTYPAEIHLVHWNIKYKKASIAQENPDGLAVIGVFVELGEKSHPVLSIISGTVPSIPYKGDRKLIKNDHLELNQLIPKRESPNYWFYSGSLTTPPYSESVQWVVMKTPIFANESQVDQFRTLYEKEKGSNSNQKVIENYRDPQNRNNRPVYNVEE